MTQIDTRPPLTFSPDHTPPVDHLRFECTGDVNVDPWPNGCGPDQRVIVAHEQEDSRMTGASWYLVYRCGGCRRVLSGTEIAVIREQNEARYD